MKRLFFILSLLFAMQISAQVEITIGDTASTQTSSSLPLAMYYRYSYSQTLYNRSELVAGEISSISYYLTSESFNSGTISIYMKETTDTVLTGFSSSEGFVQVFSGVLNLTQGWTTFIFPEIFEYSGQNNLVVAVIRTDNNYYYGYNFKVTPYPNGSIERHNDSQAYNLNTTHGSGGGSNYRPVTKFGMFPAEDYCYPPINLSSYVSLENDATISWNAGDSSSTVFALAYKTDTDEEWILESDEITDTSYTLSSLLPYTKYDIRLWTVCPNGNSFSQEQSFITHPDDGCFIYLTYEEDFDNLDDLSPWRYTHSGENRWYVGPAVNNTRDADGVFTEGNALYISNDGGLTNSYNPSSSSVSHFSTLITISDSVYYGISFDYKAMAENYSDKLTIYLVPLYQELTTSTTGFITIGSVSSSQNTWRRYETAIPQNVTPGDYQLVFTWQNNNYSGENPPMAIDNLRVQASMCAIPMGFSATITDSDGTASMTVNVNDTINQAASYIVEYRLAGETIWDTIQEANPVLIPYLPYSSVIEYRVVASCGTEGLSMPSNIATISTPCGITDEYPYKEYFEKNPFPYFVDSSHYCWTVINGGEQYANWTHYNSQGIKGSNALYFQSNVYSTESVFDDWIISPLFALNGNQRLNFQYRTNNYSNQSLPNPKIDVYLYNADIVDYSSPEDTIFCEYVTTIYDSTLTSSKWKMAEILLSDYVGNYRIALVVREITTSFFVDNFIVSDIPDCFEVYSLEVNAYSGTSVSINYDIDNISGSGVAIAYAPETVSHNFDVESADVVIISGDEQLPYILEGLQPGTTYVFAASQLCGGEWSDTTKATLPMVYTVPFSFDFDTEATTPQMNFTRNSSFNAWYVGGIYNSSFEGDTLEGRALYVTNDNGTSASYYSGYNYYSYAYLNVEFVSGAEYELFFDWICEGVANRDYLKVYLLPFGQPISEEYALTGQLNLSTQWLREQIILPANHYNGGYQLVFEFATTQYSNVYHLSAIVDNIRIEVNDCARIVDLDVSFAEVEDEPNLIVNLLDQFNTNASYVLRYKDSNELQYTEITGLVRDSFPYTLSNQIEYNKIYQLQIGVICEQGDTAYFNEEIFSVMTPCTVLETPWEVDFEENILEEQYCWTRYNGFTSMNDTTYTSDLSPNSSWTIANISLNGDFSKRLYIPLIGSDLKDWVVTPTIDIGDGSVIKQVVFDLSTRLAFLDEMSIFGDDDKFVVMISTDNGETWNVENAIVFKNNDVDTLHNLSSLSNEALPFSFKLVDANNQPLTGLIKIAFYVESTVEDILTPILCIDNLSVEDWRECQTPHNPHVLPDEIRSNLAIVHFTTLNDNAEYYEYAVVAGECDNFDTLSTMLSSETSIEILDLTDETFYTFAIRAVCEEDVTSDWISTTFTTLPPPEEIPFSTTFSDSSQWFYSANDVSSNAWSIGEATSVDTNGRAAYLSTDGGITYNAEISQNYTLAYIYKDFAFDQTENNFELLFDWKVRGTTAHEHIQSGGIYVYVMDIAPLPSSSLPYNPVAVLRSSDQWQSERIYLGNLTGDKRLVFATYSYITENEAITPAAIDNVAITISPCSMVEGLMITDVTTNSIGLLWQETDADSYVVYYRDESTPQYSTITTTDNSITLTNLGEATRYYIRVKAICGENESVMSNEITEMTTSTVATLPYICDFEGVGSNGWVIKNGDCINRWNVGAVDTLSNSALFVKYLNDPDYVNVDVPRSVVIAEKRFQLGQRDSLRISFDVSVPVNTLFDYLKVFFVPENTNFEATNIIDDFAFREYSEGVLISNSQNEESYIINNIAQTQNLSVTIPTPFNEIWKLVFVWVSTNPISDNQSAVIDNVVLEEVGDIITCMSPIANSVVASDISPTSAIISWQDNNESHDTWNVYYKAEYDENYTYVTATNQTSITLTELNPFTVYYAYVKTNCGDEQSRSTDTIIFTTHCEAIIDYPYIAEFGEGDLSCWIFEEGRLNNWIVINNTQLLYDAQELDSSMIESPIFNLTSLQDPILKFKYNITETVNNGLILYYRENQSDEWVVLREYLTTTQTMQTETISIENASSNYQIAFKAKGEFPMDIHIDEIIVTSRELALTDVESNGELKTIIYPNPASAQATLRVKNLTSDAKIILSDLQGRILREDLMKANTTTYTIDLNNIVSGVYYIRIVTDYAISTQKLIVE